MVLNWFRKMTGTGSSFSSDPSLPQPPFLVVPRVGGRPRPFRAHEVDGPVIDYSAAGANLLSCLLVNCPRGD